MPARGPAELSKEGHEGPASKTDTADRGIFTVARSGKMDDNAAYTLVKKLGTGAFGVGNLYRDNETGRNVVIKEFDLSLLEEVNGSAAAADRKRLVLDEVRAPPLPAPPAAPPHRLRTAWSTAFALCGGRDRMYRRTVLPRLQGALARLFAFL